MKKCLNGEKSVRYSGHKAVNYQIILSGLWKEQLVRKLEKQSKTMKTYAVLFFSLLQSKIRILLHFSVEAHGITPTDIWKSL